MMYPYMPLNETHLPTSPTAGNSHWHLGPALGYTSTDDVVDVRFYCRTSTVPRVIHFKTANQHIRKVAVTGSHGDGNSPSHWNTGWTALTNHSAHLPAATSQASNYGAFDRSPFAANYISWSINAYEMQCDHGYMYYYGGPGSSSHQVWIRLAGAFGTSSRNHTTKSLLCLCSTYVWWNDEEACMASDKLSITHANKIKYHPNCAEQDWSDGSLWRELHTKIAHGLILGPVRSI